MLRDDAIPLSGQTRLATFAGLDDAGNPVVSLHGEVHNAKSLVDVSNLAEGTEVAVTELAGDREHLLILGALVAPRIAEVDDRIELIGKKEVVLRCGPASIRLTPDGRVDIRGTRVLSRSDGAEQGARGECGVELAIFGKSAPKDSGVVFRNSCRNLKSPVCRAPRCCSAWFSSNRQ